MLRRAEASACRGARRLAALRIALCLVACAPAAGRAADAPTIDAPAADTANGDATRVRRAIEKIERQSARIRSLSAALVQEKHLALFEKPLVLRGNLHLQKPDRFAFRIDSPLRSTMVIVGDELRQWDEDSGEVQTISLADNPGFKLVLRQMRGWLSGSYSSMLGEYDATVLRDEPIELAFVPRENALAHGTVERVRVAFEADARHLREIEILDRQGDRTVFRFAEVRVNPEIDPSAWEADPSAE